MMPLTSGDTADPAAWRPNSMPTDVPAMCFGVTSSAHACITGLAAYMKNPSTATNAMKAGDLPASAMKTSTTAVMLMLAVMILARPILSERYPDKGEAAKPVALSANIAAPTQNG